MLHFNLLYSIVLDIIYKKSEQSILSALIYDILAYIYSWSKAYHQIVLYAAHGIVHHSVMNVNKTTTCADWSYSTGNDTAMETWGQGIENKLK